MIWTFPLKTLLSHCKKQKCAKQSTIIYLSTKLVIFCGLTSLVKITQFIVKISYCLLIYFLSK